MTRERSRPTPRTNAEDGRLGRRRFLAHTASSFGALAFGGLLAGCRSADQSPRARSTDVAPSATSPAPALATNETLIRYRDVLALPRSESLSATTLAAVAEQVHAELPAAYLRFLAATEGLAFPYSLLVGGRPYAFEFESIATCAQDLVNYDQASFRDELPPHILPIAYTGIQDDTLLLDLSRERHGVIHAWISGRPSRPRAALHEVATNLDAFFETLVLLERDVQGDERMQHPTARAWVAERGAPTPILADGIDWGRGWRVKR